MSVRNERIGNHRFLQGMYRDGYFPDYLVDRGVEILLRLCERIEIENPADVESLYVLTHATTREFNALDADFDAAGSEIETVAREVIGADFRFIASAYGFAYADAEELIGTRDW
jgi:hypothetical protein